MAVKDEVKIKEVHFERVFNLRQGSYESFRIGLTATVGPNHTVDQVVAALDRETVRIRNEHVTPVEIPR
jgi:hypothetical protein